MADGTVTIAITGDASKFRAALGDADSAMGGFTSKLKNFGGIAAGVFGGLSLDRAAQGVVSFFQGAFAEAEESIKVTKETARVIESMGGVANVTAKQVERLSTSISNKTGIDDEAIQSGANLLLTFGNIRNEVGKGNKIFDQATKLSLDMSKVMGTDMRSAALQVGKALNDPIAGLTALRRSGVQFTEAQEAQIRTLVESGRTMEAQKIILGELKREFGGAAEAAATPWEKVQTRFKNLQEDIGMKLMPVLVSVSEWFLKEGIPAIEAAVNWVEQNWPKFQEAFRITWAIVQPILQNLWDRIQAIAQIVESVVGIVKGLIEGDFSAVWENVKGLVSGVADFIWHTFLELPAKILGALADLGAKLANLVLEGLGDLVDAFFDAGAKAAKAFWNGVKSIPGSIAGALGMGGSIEELVEERRRQLQGKRASGGPIWPGTWLVGERGPELVTVGTTGYVTPSSRLGGPVGGAASYTGDVVFSVGREAIGRVAISAIIEAARGGGVIPAEAIIS